MNINWLNLESERQERFGRKMSPPWLNSLSTPAEDGTGVLYSMNKSIRDGSRRKSLSCRVDDIGDPVQVSIIFFAFKS